MCDSRKITSKFAAAVFALATLIACNPDDPKEAPPPPGSHSPTPAKTEPKDPPCVDCNVVLIVVDTLRADHLGCYGYPRETSPSIDALARTGIRFSHMSAQTSWTRPGCASILTGLYPKHHGANTRNDRLNESHTILPEMLRSAGYATFGFVTNGNVGPSIGFDQGYDAFHYLRERATRPGLHVPADQVTEQVAVLLDKLPKKTENFIHIHYSDPHDPYLPKEPLFSKNNTDVFSLEFFAKSLFFELDSDERDRTIQQMINAYDDEIRFTDKAIGRLVEVFEQNGMGDNTIFIVTSDHGEEFNEHGGLLHGLTLYEEQLAVPLIIRVPGWSARTVSGLVGQVDILPTLMSLLDLPYLFQVDGIDVLGTSGRRELSFAELDLDNHVLTSAQDDRSKLIRSHKNFYSIENDSYLWFQESFVSEIKNDKLVLKMQSFQKQRLLQIQIGEEKTAFESISPQGTLIEIPLAGDEPHTVSVKSLTPCQSPYELGLSNDRRCLGFRVFKDSNIPLGDLRERVESVYDLAADSGEKNNLKGTYEAIPVEDRLQKELDRYLSGPKALHDSGPPPELDPELVEALKALGYL